METQDHLPQLITTETKPDCIDSEHISRSGWLKILEQVNDLAQAASMEDLFKQALDLMVESVAAESATLYLSDPDSDELVLTLVYGDEESQNLVGLRLKRSILSTRQANFAPYTIIVGEAVNDPLWLRAIHPDKIRNTRNMIILPLVLEDHYLGVIQFLNYGLADLDILKLFADRLSIEASRLAQLEFDKHSNQRLKMLIEIIGQVGGTLDRDVLLQRITERAADLVNAERSSLFLVQKSTNELGFHVSYQTPEGIIEPANSNWLLVNKNFCPVMSLRPAINPSEMGNKAPNGFGFSNRSTMTIPLRMSNLSVRPNSKPIKRTVGGLMAIKKRGETFDDEDTRLFEILANQASTFLQVAELYESSNDLFMDIVKALVAAIDAKDPYTQGHSLRVFEYSVAIAKELHLNEGQISDVRIGGLLHDIGKIGISDQILGKPGDLTDAEYSLIKSHPAVGCSIMSQVRVLQTALPGIAEHHERLDGSGYPYGLRGDQISIIGRIVAVADVFDAMTSNRPYRRAMARTQTLQYLEDESGKLFDINCVQSLKYIIGQSESVSE
ncbi:MAG: HD domain-containing protein [Anaerolineaceae bacterium]|nr:HD domain-containing protein [Anaerolineaceae bacterium]